MVKGKRYSKTHVIPRSSGLKPMARSLGRRNHHAIARQAIQNPKTKAACLKVLEKDIQRELSSMVSTKRSPSCLRLRSSDALESFSWEKLCMELQSSAPTFYQVLHGCVNVKRRQRATKTHHPSNSAILGVCAALLLRHRNQNMNLLQRIISLILHSGHAAKQVFLIAVA